jgi:hypothetical protein
MRAKANYEMHLGALSIASSSKSRCHATGDHGGACSFPEDESRYLHPILQQKHHLSAYGFARVVQSNVEP